MVSDIKITNAIQDTAQGRSIDLERVPRSLKGKAINTLRRKFQWKMPKIIRKQLRYYFSMRKETGPVPWTSKKLLEKGKMEMDGSNSI